MDLIRGDPPAAGASRRSGGRVWRVADGSDWGL